jgi:hypothetical protein
MTNQTNISSVLIVLIYLVALILIGVPLSADFIGTSALMVLVVCVLAMVYHQGSARTFITFLLIALTLSWLAEWSNSQTEMLFGRNLYGHEWHLRLFGIPLIVCALWFFSVYTAGGVLSLLPTGVSRLYLTVIQGFIAAVMLMLIAYGTSLWTETNAQFLHLFLGRWLVATAIAGAFQWLMPDMDLAVARRAYALTALFLVVMGYVTN